MEPSDRILRMGEDRVDEVEVFIMEGTALSLNLKGGILDTAITTLTWGMGIRTIDRGKIGFSSTSDPLRWKECLEAAISSGIAASPQDWGELPSPVDLTPKALSADPGLFPHLEVALSLAEDLQKGADSYPSVKVTGGGVDLFRGDVRIVNSRGIDYRAPRTRVSISLETIEEESTGYEFDASTFLEVDARKVGERAAFLSAHGVNGGKIENGEYEIILSPVAAAQLIGQVIVPALSGRNVHAGRSRLAGHLEEECMDRSISLYDDPFAKGLGSTDWDAEGTPAHRIDFIQRGVLKSFAYDLKTAYRYHEQGSASAIRSGYSGSPAIGVHNLILEGERSDIFDEKALYVQDIVGAHTANPLSGDFSVELANAYWVEEGVPGEPVRHAMFAGNAFDLFRSIAGLGKESRTVGSLVLPPIRLHRQRIIGG